MKKTKLTLLKYIKTQLLKRKNIKYKMNDIPNYKTITQLKLLL